MSEKIFKSEKTSEKFTLKRGVASFFAALAPGKILMRLWLQPYFIWLGSINFNLLCVLFSGSEHTT
jgi:hypothetical protein